MTNSNTPIISVRNLKRSFADVHAVQDISFDIMPGQVIGFIGANGAGKTTTMRMMATLEIPDEGNIFIDGIDAIDNPAAVRPKMGWVPDDFGRYSNITICEYLDFFARSFSYKEQERKNRIAEVIEFTGLEELQERFVDKLSKGQGQRLCLARALLHDPEILLMDEPAAGLDPQARIELKNLILILAEEGKTIFISSHILSELQEMCSSMLFIDKGRVVHHGGAEELQETKHEHIIIDVRLSNAVEELENWCELNPGVSILDRHKSGARLRLENKDEEFIAETLKRMIGDGLRILDFHREEKKLEDAFIDILQEVNRQEQEATV